MATGKVEFTKRAVKSIDELWKGFQKNRRKVTAFTKQTDERLGTELTHRLSGTRVYQPPQSAVRGVVQGSGVTVNPGPARVIKPDGSYYSISNQEFQRLQELTIDKLDDGLTYLDNYTGARYWDNSDICGAPICQQKNGEYGTISKDLWHKILGYFS